MQHQPVLLLCVRFPGFRLHSSAPLSSVGTISPQQSMQLGHQPSPFLPHQLQNRNQKDIQCHGADSTHHHPLRLAAHQCPHTLLDQEHRSPREKHGSRTHSEALLKILGQLGIYTAVYKSQSRRGATATHLAQSRVPLHWIQGRGGWSSFETLQKSTTTPYTRYKAGRHCQGVRPLGKPR